MFSNKDNATKMLLDDNLLNTDTSTVVCYFHCK